MASEEAFTLDSLALNDGTTFGIDGAKGVDMTPPSDRAEWIGAADSEAQLLTRTPLHDNRVITIPLVVVQQATMDLVHDKIALVLDKLQKASKYPDGIALTWTPATGTRTVTFDVLKGRIVGLPVDLENGWIGRSPAFTIELTCKPYWRGTRVLLSSTSAATPFVTQELTSIPGDIPALGELIVTDLATQSRRHVEWGLESPLTYNSGTSLLVDSDNMVTSGFTGAQSTVAGAYDPNATGSNSVVGNAVNTPTAICGLGNLAHVGTFRVMARIRADTVATTPPTVKVRLTWKAADGPWTSNDWVAHTTGVATYQEMYLGTVTVPAVLSGTQRWTGQVEAMTGTASFETVTVDYLQLVPTSAGYGKARGVYTYAAGTLTGFDDFTSTTAGGVLNARAATAGGSWATSGATTDFVFADDLSGEQVKRSTTADASRRIALLGSSSYTDSEVTVGVQHSGGPSNSKFMELGVILRWVDSSNYLAVYRKFDVDALGTGTRSLVIDQVVAGVTTTLATATITSGVSSSVYHMIRAIAFASGRVVATETTSSVVTASIEASSTALATAGALASGKPGFFDRSTDTAAISRYYDNFTASTPAIEPIAIYSGRTMQVRYDDTIRDDSTATYTGRPSSYRGSRFLVPPGTSRVLVKARRADVETVADTFVTDSTQLQVAYTPRGLAVPR